MHLLFQQTANSFYTRLLPLGFGYRQPVSQHLCSGGFAQMHSATFIHDYETCFLPRPSLKSNKVLGVSVLTLQHQRAQKGTNSEHTFDEHMDDCAVQVSMNNQVSLGYSVINPYRGVWRAYCLRIQVQINHRPGYDIPSQSPLVHKIVKII